MMKTIKQDRYLLEDTIYNNIKAARQDADIYEILDAAEKAEVLDFAWEFTMGMDTLIGKAGMSLSEAQKEKILKARILLAATISNE